MDGKEFPAVENHEIAALIDALCEAPLESGTQVSTELLALRREAARALFEASGPGKQAIADADRLTAALAALLPDSDAELARQALADQAVRLDAESALAFLDAVERSAESAPSHLVDEFVAAEAASAARGRSPAPSPWSRMAESLWPARRWQVVTACLAILVASAASLSVHWGKPDQAAAPPPTVANTNNVSSAPPVIADAPAPMRPAIATTQPCAPSRQAGAAATSESRPTVSAKKADAGGDGDCGSEPGDQLADTAIKEALEKAEQARQAAAAQAAAADAARLGASKSNRDMRQADPLSRIGTSASRPAAAARAAPAAAPPAASPAGRGLR